MGNFYCTMAIREIDGETLVETLRGLCRNAYVAPTSNGVTVFSDERADSLDPNEIGSLGCTLSQQLRQPVLAVLNADDDVLVLALFEDGDQSAEYSSRGPRLNCRRILKTFGRPGKAALFHFAVLFPWVPFEVVRHSWFAKALGLPEYSVAAGYRYIAEGDVMGAAEDLFQHT
jgi:hypothetical protein